MKKNNSLTYFFIALSLSLPCLSIFGRELQNLAYQVFTREGLGYLLLTSLIVGFVFCSYLIAKNGLLKLIHIFWLAPIYLWLPWTLSAHPEERLHFLIFGALGFIAPQVMRYHYAFLLLLFLAVGDEILQYHLPSRVGELRDVGMNLLATFSAFFLFLLIQKKTIE